MDPLFDKPGHVVKSEPQNFNCEEKHNITDVCSHHFYSTLAIYLKMQNLSIGFIMFVCLPLSVCPSIRLYIHMEHLGFS
jgi:hypothetical protein